jgi:hypothetical protein
MDIWEIGREVVDWIHLAQDMHQWWAVVSEHGNEPSGFMKGGEFLD